jgi:hypothetical protein
VKVPWSVLLFMAMSSSSVAAEFPSQVLDLSGWKLTLPEDTSHPGNPDERSGKDLVKFQDSRCFRVAAQGQGVWFRAPCGGVTTKGSQYPRCELREMKLDGAKKANWGTADGQRHTMITSLAILKTPAVKKHVVCAQIHDAEDDLMMVRLEGKKLFVERNDLPAVRLDSNYKLGTRFSVKIEAEDGHVKVWYNEQLKMDWVVTRGGCYFKAGCYTQSNLKKGDAATAAGEVVVYQLTVAHKDR